MDGRRLGGERRRWWTLAAVAFGLFMVMLDNTVVNVALPSIERDLGISISELEWVVNAYALTFAVLLLTGGKLADMLGRRRIYATGIVVFAGASFACGMAGSAGTLIAARAVQGVGAALMMPATLSIISAAFPKEERGAAIGIWAGVSASALAVGPLVGGLIAEKMDWSWIFFVNVPVGALGLAAAVLLVDESRDTSRGSRLDLPGLLTAGAAVFALTYALIEGNRHGWGSPFILSLFAGAAVALAAFVALERAQRAPMLDLALFRDATFSGANAIALLISLAMFGVFFYVSIFMQIVLGYSAVEAGATFLPMTLLIVVLAPLAGKLSDHIGSRLPMACGMTLLAVSLLLLSRLGLHARFANLLPGPLLGGVGMAFTMSPMTAAALSGVPVDKAGVGSGVLSTFRQLGGALGIAIMGAILSSAVEVPPGTPAFAAQFVDGFEHALWLAAALALCGAALALATIRGVPRAAASGSAGPRATRPRPQPQPPGPTGRPA